MTTDDFWMIVDEARQNADGESAALAALTADLTRRGKRDIAAFERHTRRELQVLDRTEIRDVADQLWVLTDDRWLHLRAWCVLQGRHFAAQVLSSPGRVLRRVADARGGPFDPPSGELFLYCGEYARVAATPV